MGALRAWQVTEALSLVRTRWGKHCPGVWPLPRWSLRQRLLANLGACCPSMQRGLERVALPSYTPLNSVGTETKPTKQDITQVRGPPRRRVAREVLVHCGPLLVVGGQQRFSLSSRTLESLRSCLGCS